MNNLHDVAEEALSDVNKIRSDSQLFSSHPGRKRIIGCRTLDCLHCGFVEDRMAGGIQEIDVQEFSRIGNRELDGQTTSQSGFGSNGRINPDSLNFSLKMQQI